MVERLIAPWLVMSYSTSLRRRVIYYCRLNHELSAKGFLKLEFSMTRVPNNAKHGALLPGTFVTLQVILATIIFKSSVCVYVPACTILPEEITT